MNQGVSGQEENSNYVESTENSSSEVEECNSENEDVSYHHVFIIFFVLHV